MLLPDTTSSVRWEQFDKPAFIKAFKKAGIPATARERSQLSRRSSSRRPSSASRPAPRSASSPSLDTGTSIAIQKKFTAVGGKTIDYDRQIVGGTGSVYVTFDGNPGRAHAGSRRSSPA